MRCALAAVLLLKLLAPVAAQKPGSEESRIGYSIGYQIGADFRRQGLSLEPDLVIRGLLDAISGADPLMTPEEMNRTLIELQRRADGAIRAD